MDSGYDGVDGSGDLPAFTQDGEYQIKIKGMDASSNPSAESSEVTYKLDTTAPVASISNLQDDDVIADRVDVIGEISDVSSGIASWTLEYGEGTSPTAWNVITTGTAAITAGGTIHEWDTSALVAGNYTIRLTGVDNAGMNSAVTTVRLLKTVSETLTAPTNLTAESNDNYMVSLDWEDTANPAGTTYEVYRGTTDTFVPDFNTNLVEKDITTTYWHDSSAVVNTSYYYKVIAVYNIDENFKEISDSTAVSNQATLTTPIETGEKLGLQDFWKFTDFSAGNGAGYINVANGNLVYSSTDLVYPGYMLAMVMRRTYNSEANVKTSLGYGWDFSYNTRLYKEYDSVNDEWDLILKDGDGSLHLFDYEGSSNGVSTYTAPAGVFMEMKYYEATDEYIIMRRDYVEYTFNGNMELVKLSELNGNYLKFNYDEAGKLSSVENCDNNDNSVNQADFTYYLSTDSGVDTNHIGLLKEVTDESGRTYKYEYETGAAKLKKAFLTTLINGSEYKEEYTYATGTNNLETVKDANGNVTTLSYITGSKVSNVAYPDPDTNVTGDEISFGLNYNTANTTIVTNNWGHSTTYVYNGNGSVTGITNASGDTTTYTYNSDYQVTSVTYQNYVNGSSSTSSITTSIDYDDGESGEGNTGNVLSVTDPYGHTTQYEYDDTYIYKVDKITVPKTSTTNAITRYSYYTDGNLKYTSDAEGNVTYYTYYGSGLIQTVTNHVGSTATVLGTKTYYTYYSNGWLYETRQGSKSITNSYLPLMSRVYNYDSQGNPQIVQDAMGNKSRVDYDALGRPVKTYLPDKEDPKTSSWGDNEYTTATYDIKGNVISTADISGIVTSIEYDNMDRMTKTTVNSNINSYVYYLTNEVSGKKYLKMKYKDAENNISYEYYDELGRVEKTTAFDGTTEYTRNDVDYDKVGNVIKSRDLFESSSSYREVTYEFDKLNRNTEVRTYNDASQLVSTTTAYDYMGNATSVTDALNYTTYYTYDDIGRLTQVKQHDGTQYLYTNYSYDNISSYGGVNRIKNTITDAEGRVSETFLNEYGNAVADVTHGDSTTDSSKIYIERTYNLDGTVATVNQAAPNQTSNTVRQVDYYNYNNWGLVTDVHYGSASTTTNVTSYTYNDHGQVSSISDTKADLLNGGTNTVTTSWVYDTLGRTSSVSQDQNAAISYEYNDVNQITKLTQPSSGTQGDTEITEYNYNNLGQLESIYHGSNISGTITSNKIRDYVYLATGQLDKTVDYLKFDESNTTQTMSTKYDYTGLGEVKEIKYVKDTNSSTLEKYNYTYDKNGNIKTEATLSIDGHTFNKTYDYDSLGRLESMTYPDRRWDYFYDKVGNKTSEEYYITSSGGGQTLYQDWTYTINEFDQLTKTNLHWSNGPKDIEWYSYDARGSMTDSYRQEYNRAIYLYETSTGIDYNNDGDTDDIIFDHFDYPLGDPYVDAEYTYDKAGYLAKTVEEVFDANGNTTNTNTYHYYNGMEQRAKKTEVEGSTTETTNYFHSGSIQLFTTNGNDDKITENILAPNGMTIASQRFDGTYAHNYYFVNTDIRNSTTAIIDNVYSAKKYYRYSAFGKTEEFGDANFDNFITYTGAVSEGNDIFYMNARFYDANTARFLSQDTYTGNAWEPWTQNLYSYVGNNPVNYIDPTGHWPEGYGSYDFDWNLNAGWLTPKEKQEYKIAYSIAVYGDDSELYLDLLDSWHKHWEIRDTLENEREILTNNLNAVDAKRNEWWDSRSDRTFGDVFVDYGSMSMAYSAGFQDAGLNVDAVLGFQNSIGGILALNMERRGISAEIWWIDKEIFDEEISLYIIDWQINKLYEKAYVQ